MDFSINDRARFSMLSVPELDLLAEQLFKEVRRWSYLYEKASESPFTRQAIRPTLRMYQNELERVSREKSLRMTTQ